MFGNLDFMSRSNGNASSLGQMLLKLFGLSSIAGVLALALLAPLAIVGGIAITTSATVFEGLPDYIKPVNASQASTLFGTKNGQPVEIARFYHENRISIGYNDMSPNIRNAVVATEDPRFFEHGGVDVISLIRAVLTNAAMGGGGPGASTITMQYVKNSLVAAAQLTDDEDAIAEATAVSLDRKIREMRLAIAVEGVATKQEILAGYLNLSFFGHRLNGIEAASNYYFGISAKDLNVPQSALLAAMLKSPNDYRPDEPANLDRAKSRRDYVIDNMRDEGYITADEAKAAKATPIETNIQQKPSGCEANQVTAFFCDYTVWTVRNSSEFGPTREDREMLLKRGGLNIYTTLDIDLQEVADQATKTWVPVEDPSQIGSATVSVQVNTGRILAMAENRVFDQTQSTEPGRTSVNYAADKPFGGSSGFQVGSTYKIFTLAQWLTNGYRLNDHVDGRVREWQGSDFSARCGAWVGTWAPNNITKEPEDLTVVQATALSVNTAYAYMASKVDICDIRDTAMRFGVKRADGDPLLYYPSAVIGTNEISPLSMAAAMAAVANKGTYCTPVAIDRVVVRATNQELPVPKTICSQAVTPEVAAGMTYAMQRVISGGTGGASNTGDGTPIAGKTGTTDSGVHTWMTGFSSAVGTATWVGNVVGSKSLSSFRLNNKAANTVRHDIWRTTMKKANELYPGEAFIAPPQSMIDAALLAIPSVTGQDPQAALEILKTAGFNPKIIETQVANAAPAGTVAYTRPAANGTAPTGSQVRIFVSKGGQKVVPNVSGMTVANAKAALLAAGYSAVSEPQPSQTQYFQKSATIPKGNVIGTDPAAGTAAPAASAILLIISSGP